MVFESGAPRVGEAGCAGVDLGGVSSCAWRALGVQLLVADDAAGVLTAVSVSVAVAVVLVLSVVGLLLKGSALLNLMGDDSGVVCFAGLDCDAAESGRRKGELRWDDW